MFRKTVTIDGRLIDVTMGMQYDPRPEYGPELPRIHVGCGGEVVNDSDYALGGDGDEIWWNYRCLKCKEAFRDERDWRDE